MALEWGPATKASAAKQAAAIREAASTRPVPDPRHERLALRAEAGEFTDFSDAHACPITELYKLCRQCGLHTVALRLANGAFDSSGEESEEWAASASGRETFASLHRTMQGKG